MKRRMIFGIIVLISMQSLFSQDEPDGFASVSGKGLTTTTGGEGGNVVMVENLADLKTLCTSPNPYIIIVKGFIESNPWTEIKVASNKTIVGYGTNATLKNIELKFENVQNIIIRNLVIRDSYVEGDYDGKTNDNDAIQADNSHHIWIDHCHFTHCGDGLIDLRFATDFVTVSWVHLSNHNKAFGLGWTEDTTWFTTIHHCWFDNLNQRNPSFDQGKGHLYNNYLSYISSYGNLARGYSRLVVENSYFSFVTNPLQISDNGKLYAAGNLFNYCSGNRRGNVDEMPFDPASFYNYALDSVEQVESIVTAGARPKLSIGAQYTSTYANYSFTATIVEGNGTVLPENGNYLADEEFVVTAIPDDGWLFDHWTGDLTGDTTAQTMLLDGDKTVTAYFFEDTTQIPTSLSSDTKTSVSYYFNPARKTLNLKSQKAHKLNLWVFSLDGKAILFKEILQPYRIEIPFQDIKSGLYLLRMDVDGVIESGKFVIY